MITVIFLGALLALILALLFLASHEPVRRLWLGLALWVTVAGTCFLAFWPPKDKVQLGLDLKGGTSFTLELQGDAKSGSLQQAVEVIRKRVDGFGLAEPIIQPIGANRILVQIPGMSTARKEEARQTLQKVAKLEFRLVHPNSEQELEKIKKGEPVPVGYQIMALKETRQGKPVEGEMLVERRVQIGGQMVKRADFTVDPMGQFMIILSFKAEGRDTFARVTAENIGRRLAIVLDGVVRSAPNINSAIPGGEATITGSFTREEAEGLSSTLENPLEYPVKIVEERGVDPSLGADSVRSGVMAGIIGSAAVILFMLVYYRFLGVVAVGALVVNLTVLFGLLTQFHFTLTLPGIAGIILSVGMAVDANVLIYERIREELAAGKSITAAISGGFDKAFSSIVDANITTIISSIILFLQGSGPVKGFAITLTLGILGTLFAALVVTRNLIDWRHYKKPIQKFTMMHLFATPKFDFMRLRWVGATLSLVVIGVGLAMFAIKKPLSVDFTGGDALVVTYTKSVDTGAVRADLDKAGFSDFTLQREQSVDGKSESLLIRARENDGDKVFNHLKQAFPDAGFELKALDKVGAVVGDELKKKSATALIAGLLAILVYVTIRFEFSFAIGAIVAVVHDVVITIAIMTLFGREISLTVVGAILAIAGYSINDTIVVFDRVREILRSEQKGSLSELLNLALNLTMSRTMLTSGTTLATTIALAIFGGPVIFDFALTLLIGVSVGTYSSLFIAAPIVLWFTGGRDEYLRRQVTKPKEAVIAA